MSKKKLSMILLGVFVVIVVGAMFFGREKSNTSTMEVTPTTTVEEVKEAVEEKAEEIKEEVEQIKEVLPEIPAIPEIEEAPAPSLEVVPEEPTNDSL
jgi:ABC-type lipoprotein release transport system permease subunit